MSSNGCYDLGISLIGFAENGPGKQDHIGDSAYRPAVDGENVADELLLQSIQGVPRGAPVVKLPDHRRVESVEVPAEVISILVTPCDLLGYLDVTEP